MSTWRPTAFVSGAGAAATWLASLATPAPLPAQKVTAPVVTPRQEIEIVELANRLERRLQQGEFAPPTRDPFRFEPVRRPSPAVAPIAAPVPVSVPLPPPPPAVMLSGVAMDVVDGQEVWTAVLSTPSGVVLAKVGEPAGLDLTVSTVGPDGATLLGADGTTLTLPLSGRRP